MACGVRPPPEALRSDELRSEFNRTAKPSYLGAPPTMLAHTQAAPACPCRARGLTTAERRCDPLARADDGSTLTLLIGVMSSTLSLDRRQAIRATWMSWEGGGNTFLACFVLGSVGVSKMQQKEMGSREANDLVWLEKVRDAGVLSIHKVWEWWRLAARWPHVSFVAKTDDDSFLNIPVLLTDLCHLTCIPRLVYGGIAYSGYNPCTYQACGWSWQDQREYKRRHCADRGFYPAAPFPLGALQILSHDVVSLIANSPEIEEFAIRTAANR
ncbi:MAG: hypothetical protein SGPRY_009441 [Prymnesium sp.]